MTFAAVETSIRDGEKAYLYTFSANGTLFRYTNAEVDLNVGGFTYQAVTVTHDEPRRTFDEDSDALQITIDGQNPIPNLFVAVVPASGVAVTVSQFHRSDPDLQVVQFFQGEVASSTFLESGMADLECVGEFNRFARQMPRFSYAGNCQHVLGDQVCRVDLSAFSAALSVADIQGNLYTLTGLTAAQGGDPNYFVGGVVISPDGTDRRSVYQVEGDQVRFLLPFPAGTVGVGQTVTIQAGCDHSLATCEAKFANVLNFGGFPFVPTRNPFATGLA